MSEVLKRFDLHGRVAIVTGAVRGLGLAIAKALASAGATVVVTSRDKAAAVTAASEFKTPALGLAADVKKAGSVQALVDGTLAAYGRLDILVNNAGTTRRGPMNTLTPADWDDVLETNLKGIWLCCRAAQPALRSSGAGRIINIASMLSTVGLANRTPYIASKGGVTALTRALAVELAPDRITVNAICPGPFLTGMHDPAARAELLPLIPLGRWGDPAELGPAAVFLASEASSFMTGSSLTIDGGYTAR
jgi:NAD(P)-dependent dehydrogenase (short-subunit alcohol dehydrogenase family)